MSTLPPVRPPSGSTTSSTVQPATPSAAGHRHAAGDPVDTSPQTRGAGSSATQAQIQAQAQAKVAAGPSNQPVSLAASLANLANGAQVPATVTGQTANGQTILNTANGTLVGTITPPPAKGSAVLLQITSVEHGIQAKLLSIGGQPPTGNPNVQLALTNVNGQALNNLPAFPDTTALVGQSITGQLHPPGASAANPPQSILLKVLGFRLPPSSGGTSPAQTPGAIAPQAGQGTQPGAAPQAAASGQAAQTALPPHLAAQASASPVTAATTGQSIQGTVIGNTHGILTLQTNAGTISLPAPQNPPPLGTTVQLSTQQAVGPYSAAARLAALSSVNQMGALETLGQKWPALDEALQTLQNLNPAAAQNMINNLPHAGPKLGDNMLMFLLTMGRGTAQRLIGEDGIRTLEQAGKQQLIQQLNDDMGQLNRLSNEGVQADWRSVIFPFYDGAQMQQMQMYVERQKKRKFGDPNPEGVRFIIALEFSEMGDMQLDGRIHEDFNVVELAFRSHTELDDQIKEDVGDIFRSHLDAVNWSGTLTFVVNEIFPVEPMEEMLGTHSTDHMAGLTPSHAPSIVDDTSFGNALPDQTPNESSD